MIRIGYALIIVVVLCTGAIAAILFGPSASTTGGAISDASELAFHPHPGARLPLAAELTDETGHTAHLGDYFNKSPVLLVLDYLRCTSLCSVTFSNIVDALDRTPLFASRNYQIVAISIDPRDTPADAAAAKTKYAALIQHGRDAAGMHFLTAAPAALRDIADTIGFLYRYDRLLDAYIHPAGFVIATRDGVISQYIEGVSVSSAQMIEALAAARANKPQDLLTRIVLLCHLQGAPLGRFTIPVLAAFMSAELAAAFASIGIFVVVRRRGG